MYPGAIIELAQCVYGPGMDVVDHWMSLVSKMTMEEEWIAEIAVL